MDANERFAGVSTAARRVLITICAMIAFRVCRWLMRTGVMSLVSRRLRYGCGGSVKLIRRSTALQVSSGSRGWAVSIWEESMILVCRNVAMYNQSTEHNGQSPQTKQIPPCYRHLQLVKTTTWKKRNNRCQQSHHAESRPGSIIASKNCISLVRSLW